MIDQADLLLGQYERGRIGRRELLAALLALGAGQRASAQPAPPALRGTSSRPASCTSASAWRTSQAIRRWRFCDATSPAPSPAS